MRQLTGQDLLLTLTCHRQRRPGHIASRSLTMTGATAVGARCSSPLSWSGHIPGTPRRDLPRNSEKRRDLNRSSDSMHSAFALVRETLAQDPAYWPSGPGCRGLESQPGCVTRPVTEIGCHTPASLRHTETVLRLRCW